MNGRRAGATRRAAMAVAVVTAWSLGACGSAAQRSTATSRPTTTLRAGALKPGSKLPSEVARTVNRLKAGQQAGGPASGFSDRGVAVRDDGKVQLELHAVGPVTDAQKAALTAMGADIVAAGSDAAIVDAWVPWARADDAAALPWVATVTVPSPTRGAH